MSLSVGELFVQIRGSLEPLRRSLQDAQSESQRAGSAIGEAFKKGFGFAAGIAGFNGLTSAIHDLAKSAMDFGGEMQKVKVLADATDAEMKQLTESALKLAPAMGFKATEAAEGLKELAASGFTATQMTEMLPAVMSAAAASGEKLSLASELVASQLHSFGMEATQAGHIADVLAKASNISAIGMNDLNYSLKYAGPVAHAVGISFEELSAAIAVMGNSGIKGEQAGTTLRGAIERLINPSREAKETMEALGIKIKDSQGNLLPLADILGTFKSHLENATAAQKAQALSMVFGTEAVSGMLALIGAGPEKLKEFTKELENSTGSSKKAAEEMNDNFGGSLKKLQGTIQAIAVDIEQTLDPTLKSITDSLNKMFTSLRNSSELRDAIKKTTDGIATVFKFVVDHSNEVILALKAVAGAFVAMQVTAILNINNIIKGLQALGAAAITTKGRIGLIGLAFTALYEMASQNLWGLGDKSRQFFFLFKTGMAEMVNAAKAQFYNYLVIPMLKGLQSIVDGINSVSRSVSGSNLIDKTWKPAIEESEQALSGLNEEWDDLMSKSDSGFWVMWDNLKHWDTPVISDAEAVENLIRQQSAVQAYGESVKALGNESNTAIPQVSGLGTVLDDIGSKSKKAKEQVESYREEWDKASGSISAVLKQLQAEFNLIDITMGKNSDQFARLQAELDSLNKQYEKQQELVNKAKAGYEALIGSSDAARVADAAEIYANEAKNLSELANKINDTKVALQGHTFALADNKAKMEELDAQHDLALAQLDDESGKLQKLRIDQEYYTQKIAEQKIAVEELNEAYRASADVKGEDDEATQKARQDWIAAQKDLAGFQKSVRDTNKAFHEQAQSALELRDKLTDLTNKYDEVIKKQKDDLASALDDYQKKVSDTNKKLADDEQKLTDQFQKTLDDRAKALRDFTGLFDAVQTKNVSGSTLLDNLKGQVDAFEGWQENIKVLAAKGVDQGLIDELKQMGPKAAPEIAALTTLTDTQLVEYVSLWKRKSEDARTEATQELEQQRIDTQQKIMELRADASAQLDLYRKDWEKKNAEIRANTQKEIADINKSYTEIVAKSKDYGVNLVTGFAQGIRDSFPTLQKALEDMAKLVDNGVKQPLKINSPSRLMMEYGGYIAEGLAIGIDNAKGMVQRAASGLAGMAAGFGGLTPAAVGTSLSGSSTSNNYGGNVVSINIQGGGSASDQADQLLRELQKRGIRL